MFFAFLCGTSRTIASPPAQFIGTRRGMRSWRVINTASILNFPENALEAAFLNYENEAGVLTAGSKERAITIF